MDKNKTTSKMTFKTSSIIVNKYFAEGDTTDISNEDKFNFEQWCKTIITKVLEIIKIKGKVYFGKELYSIKLEEETIIINTIDNIGVVINNAVFEESVKYEFICNIKELDYPIEYFQNLLNK